MKNEKVVTKKEDNISEEFKNALKKAELYSDSMDMSEKAIYEQLVSDFGEKFTTEEANYVINNLK